MRGLRRAPLVPQTMSDAIPLTLTPEQERLALALSDMRQAAAAARLADQQLDHHRLVHCLACGFRSCQPLHCCLHAEPAGQVKVQEPAPIGADRRKCPSQGMAIGTGGSNDS